MLHKMGAIFIIAMSALTSTLVIAANSTLSPAAYFNLQSVNYSTVKLEAQKTNEKPKKSGFRFNQHQLDIPHLRFTSIVPEAYTPSALAFMKISTDIQTEPEILTPATDSQLLVNHFFENSELATISYHF